MSTDHQTYDVESSISSDSTAETEIPRAGNGPLGGNVRLASNVRFGVFAALGAYGVWGVFPLLFKLLDGVSPALIVAHRVIWSFVFVGGILHWQGRMGEVRAAMKNRKVLGIIALSAAFLAVNWLVFIWAVGVGRVLEISLGYFLNPLVNVAFGMAFLKERQNRWQWMAIGLAIVAVGVQSIGLGAFPIASITMAFSFGFYGFLRKTVSVGSAPGLFLETLLMFPIALLYIGYGIWNFGFGVHMDPRLMSYLVLTGPVTAGALLLFAFAARQLRLTTLGMFQYIAPTMHFLTAIYIFHEPLNSVQLISFVMIWISLGIYTLDSLGTRQKLKVKEVANG